MGITCGIVGLPNVGKSTLFNALTRAGAVAENYPFATIEPNVGIAMVPDERLDVIAEIVKPGEIMPTAIEFTDIAGLVAGASQGEGLGNQFLGHIREVDAIAHVVRCFDDADIAHVEGRIDPVSDVATINTELVLADLATAERVVERNNKRARSGDAEAKALLVVAERLVDHLGEGEPARTLKTTDSERELIATMHLLTMKPTMYIANIEDGQHDSDHVAALAALAAHEAAPLVTIAAGIEAEIADLEPDEAVEFLADLGQSEPGLNRVIRAAYDLLGLNTFFTAGEKQVRAWTYRMGMTAAQCAGMIHTDFERGFIRAEVIAYDDFVTLGGEAGAKEAGRWRLEGRDYHVVEGDVILFRFNV
jgi:GTP-binding protein YchF